jgi:hypothetical protein
MLIKGVTGGKDKGNPIEYSPAEKYPKAVEKFLNQHAEEGKMLLFQKAEVKEGTFTKKGLGNNGYSDNSYIAKGKVWYKVLDVASDKLYPAKQSAFEIAFEDCCDGNGMPDLKLTSLKLQ